MKNWKLFFFGGLFAFFLWLVFAIWELFSPTVSYLPAGLLLLFLLAGIVSLFIAGTDFLIRLARKRSGEAPSLVPLFLLSGVTMMVVFILCVGVSGQLWRIQFYRLEPKLSELAQKTEQPGFVPSPDFGSLYDGGPEIAFDPGPPVRFLAVVLHGFAMGGTGYVYDPSDTLMDLMRAPETQGHAGAPGTRTELNFGYALTSCEKIKAKWYRCTVDLAMGEP